MRKLLLAFLACAFLLAGCGQSGADESQDKIDKLQKQVDELEKTKSTTTTEAVSSSTRPATATTRPTTTQPPATTAPPTTAAPAPAPSASLMPDVVCMNLQDAQDYIQATTDVFLSLSEDATGQGRSQLIDSNWVVVSQRPAAGTPIGEGDAVLSVVKLDEPNDC